MDTNNPDGLAPVEVNEDEEQQSIQKVEKPYGALELVTFGKRSALAGFQFWQRQYGSSAQAIAHITALGKDGEAIVTGWINNQLAALSRTKATSAGPGGESEQETKDIIAGKLARGGDEIILVSADDAEKYVPGQRERFGLSYYHRLFLEARKEFAKLSDEDKKNTANPVRMAFQEARVALNKAIEEDTLAQLG